MKKKIMNREEFFSYINELTYKSETELSCIILDIDNSKELFGTKLSDELSNSILFLLSEVFNGVCSQIGRDSYSCFLVNKVSIFEIAERKRELELRLSKKLELNITFSMGISQLKGKKKFSTEIFSLAFESLLLAKKQGINKTHFYEEEPMKLKSAYFRKLQLEQLSLLSKEINQSESFILRQALDEYIRKFIN